MPLADEDAPTAQDIKALAQDVQDMAHRTNPEHRKALRIAMELFMTTIKPFRFLDLPAELRNTIYELILVDDETAMIDGECHHQQRRSAAQPALTKVNRQTRSEALSIFYGLNAFEAQIHRCDFAFFIGYMNAIGAENSKRIKHIEINLKDRWTCAVGLKDFVRWAATTALDISNHYDILKLETQDWYFEHDPAYKPPPYAINKIHGYMNDTDDMFHDSLNLALDLRDNQTTSEMYVRSAFDRWLDGWSHPCACFAHQTRLYSLGGFCTSGLVKDRTHRLSSKACEKARRKVETCYG